MRRRCTWSPGRAPSVALHIPWDRVDDYDKLRRYAEDLGVRLGTINTNTFQDDDYKLGSLTHVDDRVRAKAIAHMHECIDIMEAIGSSDLKIWLARRHQLPGPGRLPRPPGEAGRVAGRVYGRPGPQASGSSSSTSSSSRRFTLRTSRTGERPTSSAWRWASERWCASTPDTMLPGPTWNSSSPNCCDSGRLGSFDFNSRFYADDDLIVGAADPFQLFRILYEVVRGGGWTRSSGVGFMLDQCHNIEEKIPGQIRSVLNVQEMMARALLVDRSEPLAPHSASSDVLGANEIFMDAFYTDVRPRLAEWRSARGLPGGPAGGLPRRAATPSGSSPSVSVDPVELGSVTMNPVVRRSPRPFQPTRGRIRRNTNYAGGNTSAKGDRAPTR